MSALKQEVETRANYVAVPMELPKHAVAARKYDRAERAALVGISVFVCVLAAALTHGRSHADYDVRAFTDAKPGIAMTGRP